MIVHQSLICILNEHDKESEKNVKYKNISHYLKRCKMMWQKYFLKWNIVKNRRDKFIFWNES